MGERKDAMPRTRTALAVVIGLAALVAPGQAFALCSACTAVVRLDAGLADCFVHKAAEEMKALQAGAAIVVVDLADCPDRGGLPTGDASEPGPATRQPLHRRLGRHPVPEQPDRTAERFGFGPEPCL